jgi:hypothetical protein
MRKNGKIIKKFVSACRMHVALHRRRKEKAQVISSADRLQHFLTEAKARCMKVSIRRFINHVVKAQRWWRSFIATTKLRIDLMVKKWESCEASLRASRLASFHRRLRQQAIEHKRNVHEREQRAEEEGAIVGTSNNKRDQKQDFFITTMMEDEKKVFQRRLRAMEVPAKIRRRLLSEWLVLIRRAYRVGYQERSKLLEQHRIASFEITLEDILKDYSLDSLNRIAKNQKAREEAVVRQQRKDAEEEEEDNSHESTFLTSVVVSVPSPHQQQQQQHKNKNTNTELVTDDER